jgi:flagellar assembly protein FliH
VILREIIVSKDRHRLGFAAPEPAAEISVEIKPDPLTSAAVIAWLEDQDDSARIACAGVLAGELEQLRAAARADGYAEGAASALREMEARYAAALFHMTEIARAADVQNRAAADDLASACAVIVAEAFAKLASEALVTQDAALGAVRSVLNRVRDGRRYTVYVHPGDLAAVEARRGEFADLLSGAALDLRADSALVIGGCRLESEHGTLNAAFDVQLRALFDTLRAAYAERGAPP